MLKDQAQFEIVEEALRKDGSIARFEEECGPVKGRMMITITDIPEGVKLTEKRDTAPIAFEASFDFYNSTAGIALYTKDRTPATGIWVTLQEEDAEAPTGGWIEFFIKTLVSSIDDDGSYGVPIYSLVSDTADLTVVPTAPGTV